MRINKKYDMFYDPTDSFGAKAKKKVVNTLIYIFLSLMAMIWILPFLYLYTDILLNG